MDLIEKTKNINRHPWELSRTENIIDIIIDNIKKEKKELKIMDIGAGDRYFDHCLLNKLDVMSKIISIYSVDINYTVDEIEKDKRIKIFNDIASIEDSSIDILILMDVLEHIDKDDEFLKNILRKVNKSGFIFITVPAHQFLYSSHDKFLKHFRRYSFKELNLLLQKVDLDIIKIHYFYFSLFIARFILNLISKIKNINKSEGIGCFRFDENSIITKVYKSILNIDFYFCKLFYKFGIKILGLSLLAICRLKK